VESSCGAFAGRIYYRLPTIRSGQVLSRERLLVRRAVLNSDRRRAKQAAVRLQTYTTVVPAVGAGRVALGRRSATFEWSYVPSSACAWPPTAVFLRMASLRHLTAIHCPGWTGIGCEAHTGVWHHGLE
jgi:hypothetical protein